MLSAQVLQEFYVQATRSWLRFRVVATSVALVQQALATAERWRISYWDAAVVEARRLPDRVRLCFLALWTTVYLWLIKP